MGLEPLILVVKTLGNLGLKMISSEKKKLSFIMVIVGKLCFICEPLRFSSLGTD